VCSEKNHLEEGIMALENIFLNPDPGSKENAKQTEKCLRKTVKGLI
jgi:hypothetical protein